jgi:hypothetical protein
MWKLCFKIIKLYKLQNFTGMSASLKLYKILKKVKMWIFSWAQSSNGRMAGSWPIDASSSLACAFIFS